jgi:hypothetical protein
MILLRLLVALLQLFCLLIACDLVQQTVTAEIKTPSTRSKRAVALLSPVSPCSLAASARVPYNQQ